MVLLATRYQLLLLVMTQENQSILLEQAKQGDAKAIASLLNQQLQPKGITAKVANQENCLQIMLEAVQVQKYCALVVLLIFIVHPQ